MNKKLRIGSQVEGEDRLSTLSDDLIHKILSFLGTRLAVQTSILSKRWKDIWTTLPFLTFDWYDQLFPFTHSGIIKFIDHVLSHRNHQLNIFSFKFFAVYPMPRSLIDKLVEYPILYDVQDLDFDLQLYRHSPFKLSTFSSNSIQKLRLGVCLDFGQLWESDDCWDLPALTTLHLICPIYMLNYEVPEPCLFCLPALTTLHLTRCEFPELVSISLPSLTTLTMSRCKLPREVWDFPALLTLELDDVLSPDRVTDLVSALFSLQNLTINFCKDIVQDYYLYCPELLNLKISTSTSIGITPPHKIELWAPKLCRIYSVGIFEARLFVSELENANVKLWDTNEFNNLTMPKKKVFYRHMDRMFWELGSAKILTIDSATFEALSMHFSLFNNVSSPFCNLKYVKLPQGYKESSVSTILRKYLLGGSPGATIVTSSPQNNESYHAVPVPLTSQKVMLDKPLATPTEELVDFQEIHKKVCVDTVEKRVQVEHLVETSVVDVDSMRYVGAPIAGISIDQGSSSRGNSKVFKDLELKSEFVGLLDLIMEKYPETFTNFTAKNKRFFAMELHMLGTSVNEFFRTSMTEFSTDIITEYKDLFDHLQRREFNVHWLVSHLNYIEQLRFSENGLYAIDSRTGDANTKLQVVQSYCLEKLMKI